MMIKNSVPIIAMIKDYLNLQLEHLIHRFYYYMIVTID